MTGFSIIWVARSHTDSYSEQVAALCIQPQENLLIVVSAHTGAYVDQVSCSPIKVLAKERKNFSLPTYTRIQSPGKLTTTGDGAHKPRRRKRTLMAGSPLFAAARCTDISWQLAHDQGPGLLASLGIGIESPDSSVQMPDWGVARP